MSDGSQPGAVTRLLTELNAGDRSALDRLFPLVYAELRMIADREMRGERPGHTLQPTALVHEAYLRLLGGNRSVPWNDRAHFLSSAARAMRNVLVDHARTRNARKRGSGLRVTLDEGLQGSAQSVVDFVVLDDALTRLGAESDRAVKVVELRFFGGLELEEIAQVLGVSLITVNRDWRFAKAWLADALGESGSSLES